MVRSATSFMIRSIWSLALLVSLVIAGSVSRAQDTTLSDLEEPYVAPVSESTTSSSLSAGHSTSSLTLKNASHVLDGYSRNVRVGLFNQSNTDFRAPGHGNSFYSYFSFNYRLPERRKIALRPAFVLNFPDSRNRRAPKETQAAWADSFIMYANDRAFLLPADVWVESEYRLYFPTSETSKDRGLIASVMTYFTAHKRWTSRLETQWHLKPSYAFQSRVGYLNEDGYPRGNRHYRFEHFLQNSYALTSWFALSQSIGTDHSFNHAIASERMTVYPQESFSLDLAMNFSFLGTFITTGISQERDIRRPRNSYALFRDKETQYFARTYIGF